VQLLMPQSESISSTPSRGLPLLALPTRTDPVLVCDFDTESRPLSWINSEFVSSEITAVAWTLHEDGGTVPFISTWLLGEDGYADLMEFWTALSKADIVTGHFIRRHDLPRVNAMRIEIGLGPLPRLFTQDTHGDLTRIASLSKSQEGLGDMLGLVSPKVKMTPQDWREANRLTTEGILKTEERVIGDVRQHVELRRALLDRGLLKPGRYWSP
jgi:hypothetical protein